MTEASDIHSSYDLLQNQFPEAIIILDPQKKIVAVDKQTLSIFGWGTESELVGKDGMTFVVEEDRGKAKYIVSKVLSDNYVKDVTFRALKKDGSTIQVAGSASLLVDSQGNPKEIVLIVHDVALQKAGIEQHKPVRMVGTVHDVTHEKEIDKVKTQFLSLASHQLRGPLTTINWHAEMLLQQQSEGLSETQKKYIQELYNASKRTVQLTNALLNVSSLELGTMPFKPEDLSLEKIAKRVLEDYQNQIAEKHLTFNEEYADNLPMVKTDLFLLKTIYHTLISNAVNYTPDGGKIDFHIGLDPQQQETFIISITDTGYGIPKDQQDKIFTKLFRAPNAKAKVMNGTGLDLYIVKLILELNGGDISFVSEENKGTAFTITLPFVPKPVQQEAKNA